MAVLSLKLHLPPTHPATKAEEVRGVAGIRIYFRGAFGSVWVMVTPPLNWGAQHLPVASRVSQLVVTISRSACFRVKREGTVFLMAPGLTPSSLLRNLDLEGRLIGRRFRQHWRNYLLQCGLSTLALLLVLLVMDVVLQAAIVVAIASSAFIVFIMPHSKASRPLRVIGGHVVATLSPLRSTPCT